MRIIQTIIISCFLIALFSTGSSAQSIAETRFSEYITGMPEPRLTMDETLQSLGGDQDKTIKDAFALPKSQRDFILRSFFERFKNNIAAIKKNKALLKKYSPEEQRMMQSFMADGERLDEEGQFAGFSLIMDTRPAVSSGKLSWNKLSETLSKNGMGYYRQVLQIEKSLNWPVFSKEVAERDLLNHMFERDDEINAINGQLELDKAKVPVKKVKVFEGMDAVAEIPDPQKMLKLLKDADQKRQNYFQRKHTSLYSWWKINAENIYRCANELSALLDAIDYGKKLDGNDRQLIALVADVQERVWEALMHLNSISFTIAANGQTAAASRKMTEDAAGIYRKMESPD